MTQITLTPDQSRQLATAMDGIVIADAVGNVVVRIPARTTEAETAVISEAKRRLAADQPSRTLGEFASRMTSAADS